MTDRNEYMVTLAEERNHLSAERTQLAAERTLSAWIRTSLGSIGGGFAIVRLLEFQNLQHRLITSWVGEILIVLGIFILIFSLSTYRKRCKNLKVEAVKANDFWLITTVLTLIGISSLLFYVAIT